MRVMKMCARFGEREREAAKWQDEEFRRRRNGGKDCREMSQIDNKIINEIVNLFNVQ